MYPLLYWSDTFIISVPDDWNHTNVHSLLVVRISLLLNLFLLTRTAQMHVLFSVSRILSCHRGMPQDAQETDPYFSVMLLYVIIPITDISVKQVDVHSYQPGPHICASFPCRLDHLQCPNICPCQLERTSASIPVGQIFFLDLSLPTSRLGISPHPEPYHQSMLLDD